MHKYHYSEILKDYYENGKPIPVDANEFAINQIMPILDKFPDVKEDALRMIEEARLNRKFTDKTRSIIFHPVYKQLPMVTMEFHNGIIKQFSYSEFYGPSCYFPYNQKNKSVIFDNVKKKKEESEKT